MKTKLLLMFLIAFAGVTLAQKKQTLTKKQLAWFQAGEWHKGFAATPHATVNVFELATQYQKFPERWALVFKFLAENDLKTLPLGKTTLSEEVKVNVQEYTSKDPGEQRMEGHQKFIDLQYVISGREIMGIVPREQAKEIVPYDEKKDNAAFQAEDIAYHVATPERFFLFFPSDIHFPGIQFGDKSPIRKITFKIKYN